MTQLWTIANATTGEVLAITYPTESTGVHPKDRGWPWDAATQKATRIDAEPDPSTEAWNGATWEVVVDILRSRAWAAVKTRRDAAEWGGCLTPLGRVDTDRDSQRKISGSVQMAMIAASAGQSFALDWTMQDNTTVPHDASAMISMGVAVGQHVAACHEVALGKRAAIEAANDAAAITAIDIDEGWPDV